MVYCATTSNPITSTNTVKLVQIQSPVRQNMRTLLSSCDKSLYMVCTVTIFHSDRTNCVNIFGYCECVLD